MSNYDMENKIKKAYKGLAPDMKKSIIADAEKTTGVVTMTEKKKINYRAVLAIAACFALVFGAFGVTKINANKVCSTVVLDVNPSIEICLNKNEKVVEVKALNDDAKAVIGDMDFKGASLEVTVNALVGSLVRTGYISADANSILVSVNDTNATKGKEREEKLMIEIEHVLSDSNVDGSILAQVICGDTEIAKLAAEHNISEGKAALILEIVHADSKHKFEDFVSLTINEINAFIEANKKALNSIDKKGSCCLDKYIDIESVKSIVMGDAGLKLNISNIVDVDVELDCEDGKMVYEVEIKYGDKDFEYKINAKDGTIIYTDLNGTIETNIHDLVKIGEAFAKEIALKHAGLVGCPITKLDIDLEVEHGSLVYEVSFEYSGNEYSYKINVFTGDIIKVEIEKD